MAKLTMAERKRIPASKMGVPSKKGKRGSFPMPDKVHQRKAIQLAPRSYNAGNISKSTEEHIISKAKRMLHGAGKGSTSLDAAARAMARKRK
jgi:hypothetical protein